MEFIKNTERRKHQRGATHHPRGWGRAPYLMGPLAGLRYPSLSIWSLSPWKKIISKLSGRNTAATRRNQSRASAELFCRGNIPPGGGNHHHRHHHRSSHLEGVNLQQHLHQHHHIPNARTSLVSNLCPKTSDWYLWVANSVDYSL